MPRGADERECFDPGLARFPTARVSVSRIVDPLAVSHAPERIEEYRRAMESGDRFPPISVVRIADRFYVADGHKRFAACRALGAREIPVELWPVRRWFADQCRQLAGKLRQWREVAGAIRDPALRPRARRLIADTRGHWMRIARSLGSRRREGPP